MAYLLALSLIGNFIVVLGFLRHIAKENFANAKERNLLLTRIQAPERVPLEVPQGVPPSEHVGFDDDEAYWDDKAEAA